MERTQNQRVCIVGSGVAGLATAKVLLADGFEVVVFEKERTLGGVWCESRTYPSLRTNDPREFYRFSDHPYPSSTDDYPKAEQVRDYLLSYAERFGIADRIRFGTEVTHAALSPAEEGDEPHWDVTVQQAAGQTETESFDFLVVCNGVFSEPYVPEVEGRDRFSGVVAHSSELEPKDAEGRRIVVVGSSKSGLDLASWAAEAGSSCTLVFREASWMLPRFFWGWLNLKWVIFPRFFEAFAPYYHQNRFESWLHQGGAPLVGRFWRTFTAILRRELRGTGPLIPKAPLPARAEDLAVGTHVYEQVRRGEITAHQATITGFPGGGAIELSDGTQLEADLVLFATGWRHGAPFLEEEVRSRIEGDEGFQLYRMILPPEVPQIGFIGYNSSFSNTLTAEISAHWLSQRFRGELALPSAEIMKREAGRFREWLVGIMPRFQQGFFIGPFLTHYHDDLLRDMGVSTRRAHDFVSENLLPMWPGRYRTLLEERKAARGEGDPPRSRLYFSTGHALALLVGAWIATFLWGG